VVVLDRTAGLLISHGATPSKFDRLLSIPAALQPNDAAAGRIGTQETVFLTLFNSSTGLSAVWAYTASGEEQRWPVAQPGHFTGIAADTRQNAIYVADTQTRQVFKVAWGGTPRIIQSYSIPAARALGPIQLDQSKGELFLGDPSNGVLFRLNLGTGDTARVAAGLGDISGFALDTAAAQLYVADGRGNRISVFSTTTGAQIKR
jgi:DNA-binding beta-propeller fold protein YncE